MLMNNLIFTMASRGWAWNIIRSLFGWLDSVAYFLFSSVMQLIFDIISVTSDPAFNNFYNGIHSRIYAIIAIYMLFKITISLLTYLVNPDSMNDKERGVGKMATRVIVALVMLIAFPNVFTFINKIQPHIIEAIPRVILGTETTSSSDSTGNDLSSQMGDIGKQIAFDTYNGVWFNDNCADSDNTDAGKCFAYTDDSGKATVAVAVDHINDAADGDSGEYRYNYYPLVGFVTALIMTIILLGYCVDISIRVFKLIILQIIAPIPIISYIDPKSSKDGAFSKWLKMVGSVYLDVFIKLAIIYFILLVISELISSGTIANLTLSMFGKQGTFRSGMVMVALVMGLFFFAKEAPKFIADALGIKMSENSHLFGGLSKIAAAATLGAGAIGSGIASGRSSFMADEANGKNHNVGRIFKNVGAGLVGAASGLGTGANAALNAKDHHAKAAMDAMIKRNAKVSAIGAEGGTTLGGAASLMETMFTGQTPIERSEADWKKQEEAIKYDKQKNAERKAIIDRASSKGLESYKTSGNISNFQGASGKIYNLDNANAASYNSVLEAAMSGNGIYHTYSNGYGTTFTQEQYNALSDDQKANWTESGSFFDFNGQSIDIRDAKMLQHEINDANIADYAEKALAGTIDDPVITGADKRFAEANNGTGVERVFNGGDGLKGTFGKVNNDITSRELKIANQKNDPNVRRQQANNKVFNKNGN